MRLIRQFDEAWDKWVCEFLEMDKKEAEWFTHHYEEENDEIFKSNLKWSFEEEEELAEDKFLKEEDSIIDEIDEKMYQIQDGGFTKLIQKI